MIEKWTQLRFEEMGSGLGELEDLGEGDARLRSESARMALEDLTPGPFPEGKGRMQGWWEEYLRLRGYGWPWRVAVYVAWCALPKEKRWPRTQDELAREVLGLASDRVIFQWRKKNPGIEDAIAVLQGGVLFEHRAGVLEALVESAKNPNYKGHQDRKLFFEMIGDYTPRSEQSVKVSGEGFGEDLSGLSEEELVKLAGGGREYSGGKIFNHEEHKEHEEDQVINHEQHEQHETSENGGEEGDASLEDEVKEWSDE